MGPSLYGGWTKNFKLLPDVSFDSDFQKIALSSLLLFSCASYWVDPVYIQWNEVATSAACNFNNSWALYLSFSNIINLIVQIFGSLKIQNSAIFILKKKSPKKFFHIYIGLLFRNGGPYWYECCCVLRDLCGLSKKCSFVTFPKI